jgi:hypothetical protein
VSIGRRYSIFGQRAMASSAPQTAVGLTAGGANLKRAAIYDITFGSNGTPTDVSLLYEAQRYTAAGTGLTTTAPTALDPGDTAADTSSVQANTSDPTFTANTILGYWPVNQRATHRWIADTFGPIMVAAVASNGIGIWGTNNTYTGVWSAMVHFWE